METSKSLGPLRLSITVATCGRVSLLGTLESLVNQDWQSEDEVIVVANGDCDSALAVVKRLTALPLFYVSIPQYKGFGGPQRDRAIREASGDVIVFLDDDDAMRPGGLKAIRTTADPRAINMYRAHTDLGILPAGPRLVQSGVTTQNVVVPNAPDRLPRWPARRDGDYWFLRSAVDRGWVFKWHSEIVSIRNAFTHRGEARCIPTA